MLTGRKILIVEDNAQNRLIFKLALSVHGAILEFDHWGDGAVDRLRLFAPVDLIILDLMLPGGISGYDVYDSIRRHSLFQKVPIVAVSASEPSSAIPKVRAKGFAGFIGKPIDEKIFAQQILRLIRGEPVWYAAGVDIRLDTHSLKSDK